MKYIKLFEDFNDYDPYELMIIPPIKKGEMIANELYTSKPNINLISDLISLGADLDIEFLDGGFTPLYFCAVNNYPEIAKMLIDAGANVDWRGDRGRTALHVCAIRNNKEIAKMLIDAGADLNVQDKEGYTALHLCAFISFKGEIARMLIDAGADVNIQQGYDGKTALMNFILYGEIDIVELILERPDVDVNIKSNEGNTAWSLASRTIRKRFPKLKPTE